MKIVRLFIYTIIFALYLSLCTVTFASDYVLPYPSYMPGHKLYVVSEWFDQMKKYWFFGDISGLKYERAMADKYLIEAETLFEYGQYKFAVEALSKSDTHFTNEIVHLISITNKEKDDGQQKDLVRKQAERPKEILTQLEEMLPETIVWQEEHQESQEYSLRMILLTSKTTRDYAYR